MSFSLWVVCCWLCIVTIQAQYTHTDDHQKIAIIKRSSQSGSLSSSLSPPGGLRLRLPVNGPESHRPARSSLGLPVVSPQRNDDAFWAMRGKRPHMSTHREEGKEAFGPTTANRIDSDSDEEAYVINRNADRNPSDERDIVQNGTDDEALGFSEDRNVDDDKGGEGELDVDIMAVRKRNKPFWISRGKKGISDYIPFYWGSNQNAWGKVPLRGMPTQAIRREVNNSAKTPRSIPVSGWESNQSFWGKRNDNGPFWISRGKRDDTGLFWISRGKKEDSDDIGSYWITRGKRPLYTEQYWGSNPFTLGKRVSEGKHDEDITDLQESGLAKKIANSGPFWVSRGKKASPQELQDTSLFWVTRGRRSDNTTFWVTRGKKASEKSPLLDTSGKKELKEMNPFWIAKDKKAEAQPFWVARGKKESGTSPFWVARGKKEDQTPFWITRGKKNNDEIPFWFTRGRKEDDDTNFWIARGKKDDDTSSFVAKTKQANDDTSIWAARGKKENNQLPFRLVSGKKETDEIPFWEARGKRKNNQTPLLIAGGKKDNEKLPFSVVREKKDDEKPPFWIVRGKKENEKTPFWVVRGKKDNDQKHFWIAKGKKESETLTPFWVTRGKKEDSTPYWISRVKKDPTSYLQSANEEEVQGNTNPFWIARGKKNDESYRNPYWITRGKKNEVENATTPWVSSRGKKIASNDQSWIALENKNDPEEKGEIENGLFWITRGRRTFWTARGKRPHALQEKQRDLLLTYVIEALLGQQTTEDDDEVQHKGLRGKKGSSFVTKHLSQTQSDDNYAKGFIALRG